MKWKPISTAPLGTSDEPKNFLVWVADGGNDGKGCVAFGYGYKRFDGERVVKASGFGGTHEWKITDWIPLPGAPEHKE